MLRNQPPQLKNESSSSSPALDDEDATDTGNEVPGPPTSGHNFCMS